MDYVIPCGLGVESAAPLHGRSWIVVVLFIFLMAGVPGNTSRAELWPTYTGERGSGNIRPFRRDHQRSLLFLFFGGSGGRQKVLQIYGDQSGQQVVDIHLAWSVDQVSVG